MSAARCSVATCSSRIISRPLVSHHLSRQSRSSRLRTCAEATSAHQRLPFIATNNFKVKEEMCTAFEDMWKSRETHLTEMPGFVRFALLKGPDGEYISQSTWENREAFEGWTKSQQFSQAHGKKDEKSDKRPAAMGMMEGPPVLKFYETVTAVDK